MRLETIIKNAIESKCIDHPVHNDSRELGMLLVAAKRLDFGGHFDLLVALVRSGAWGIHALRVVLARNPNTPREVAEEVDPTTDRKHYRANPAYILFACEDDELQRLSKQDEMPFASFDMFI